MAVGILEKIRCNAKQTFKFFVVWFIRENPRRFFGRIFLGGNYCPIWWLLKTDANVKE